MYATGSSSNMPLNRPPVQSRRKSGVCFLLAVVVLISFVYFGYVTVLLRQFLVPLTLIGIIVAVSFHIVFILLLSAFAKAVLTDPGSVPANWGFYFGDDIKRRRYCKVCHVWKPDRTHHCSACGRCVLNMDHHCPWINNCVGFYNRRFFVQLLFYAICCLCFIFVHGFYFIFVQSLMRFPSDLQEEEPAGVFIFEYIYVCLILFISMVLIFALVPFSRFHLNLVVRNSTTIENMDVANRDRSKFDLGIRPNLEQVFGASPFCWLIPLHGNVSRPVGDGVQWRMHYTAAVGEEPR
eukprot:GHVT01063947.1.p1 GENE.GHVT01063947.1~~GHVT01063947.1.p1  ORF type:complete len:294 (+),score=-3.01 GHVT01063947.1:983-1864(+)